MIRIAIIGGGISGLTAAFELEKARRDGAPLDWHLYEASDRLGGTIETTRLTTAEGEYILEGGPDGWVTEKPWARELATELGLGGDLIYSNDATRKTYIYLDGQLQAIPDGMRLMVPEDLQALEGSPLFSTSAKQAYADELARAADLRSASPLLHPEHDESVAEFVLRHFGDEVLNKLAAPLLSGVFGGDVRKLSVRAVMPQFVRMEREHGSLILALQRGKRERGGRAPQPIFTSLHGGVASLIEALAIELPEERIHLHCKVENVWDDPNWSIVVNDPAFGPDQSLHPLYVEPFSHLFVCVPIDATRWILPGVNYDLPFRELLPGNASSAILVSLTWPAELASTFTVPPGFGFLIPEHSPGAPSSPAVFSPAKLDAPPQTPQLLACTFVDQKFPYRAPAGARILRAFFGGLCAEQLSASTDEQAAAAALAQLRTILGPLPEPQHTEVRRWPRSLPQYELGHLDRMAQLDRLLEACPGLTLLGNSYRGVGLPDLIRDARNAARRIIRETLENQ